MVLALSLIRIEEHVPGRRLLLGLFCFLHDGLLYLETSLPHNVLLFLAILKQPLLDDLLHLLVD